MKRFCRLFFLILSFPTIIWGFIYGSFFGASITANNVWNQIAISDFINDRRCKYDSYFYRLFLGFIQLVVGLMINGIQLSKQKRYLDSINESYAWLGIFVWFSIVSRW